MDTLTEIMNALALAISVIVVSTATVELLSRAISRRYIDGGYVDDRAANRHPTGWLSRHG